MLGGAGCVVAGVGGWQRRTTHFPLDAARPNVSSRNLNFSVFFFSSQKYFSIEYYIPLFHLARNLHIFILFLLAPLSVLEAA